jgi:hypothetical protein
MEGLSGGGVIGAGCQPHRIIVEMRVDQSADPAMRTWVQFFRLCKNGSAGAAGSMSALVRQSADILRVDRRVSNVPFVGS